MLPDVFHAGDWRIGRWTAGAMMLVACADQDGSHGAQLLVPDDVVLHWDESFNGEDDGLGALIPIDVMVYDGLSGEPLAGTEVLLETPGGGTWLLLEEDVLVGDPDEDGDVVDMEGDASPPDVPSPRDHLWDARRDQYFALQLTEVEADLGRISLETDLQGLSRVYVYVDAFSWDDAGSDFIPEPVLVSLGAARASGAEQSFDLIPR